MRLLTPVLLALLVLICGELLLGKNGVPRVMQLQAQVREQTQRNTEAQAANDQLDAEVADLKDGLEIVEEKARFDYGMVKPHEILVRLNATGAVMSRAAPPADGASTPGPAGLARPRKP